MNYVDVLQNEIPKVSSNWSGNILNGEIKYTDITFTYRVDCSTIDFEDVESNTIAIEQLKIEFDLDKVGASELTKRQIKTMLLPHVPFFEEFTSKEMEVLAEKKC